MAIKRKIAWPICLFTLSHTFGQKFLFGFDFYGTSFGRLSFLFVMKIKCAETEFDWDIPGWNIKAKSFSFRFECRRPKLHCGHFRNDDFNKCVNEPRSINNIIVWFMWRYASFVFGIAYAISNFASIIRLECRAHWLCLCVFVCVCASECHDPAVIFAKS